MKGAKRGLYNPRVLPRPARSAGFGAQVAQLVEHVTENHGVGGSIPPLGTIISIKANGDAAENACQIGTSHGSRLIAARAATKARPAQ